MKKKFLKIEKRLRLVIASLLMSLFFLISTFFFFDKALIFIPLLIVVSYFLTYFALLEEIEKIEWGMLFLPPILLVISTYLFYFLFPGRWLTRLPAFIFFGISYYALLLCSNIFNVGVEKSLQLYRPAFSINVFYQLVILFFLLQVIASFRFNFLINGLLTGGVSFILALHFFWTRQLKLSLDQEIIIYSAFIGLLLTEAAMVLSFVPLNSSVFSLFLIALYYTQTNLIFNFLEKTLFKETIREYLIVLIFIFIVTVFTIKW
jgi:hypothetical protein